MGLDINFYKIDGSGNHISLEYIGITYLRDTLYLFVDLLQEYAYNYTLSIGDKISDVDNTYCHNSHFNTVIFDIEYQVLTPLKEQSNYNLTEEDINKIKQLSSENKLKELKKYYEEQIIKIDEVTCEMRKFKIERIEQILNILRKYKDSTENIYYRLS